MNFSKLAAFLIAGFLTAASAPVWAQQTPASASTSDADETTALIAKANAAAAANAKMTEAALAAPVAKIGATPEAIKKAKDFGFHAEVFSGKTFFCREDATVGTRLTSKRCIDAMQFEDYAVQLQIARDTMRKDVCQGGKASATLSPCGGMQDRP